MFLVYEIERNIFDHRFLEYAIYELDPHVRIIRRTLNDVKSRGHLSKTNRLIM